MSLLRATVLLGATFMHVVGRDCIFQYINGNGKNIEAAVTKLSSYFGANFVEQLLAKVSSDEPMLLISTTTTQPIFSLEILSAFLQSKTYQQEGAEFVGHGVDYGWRLIKRSGSSGQWLVSSPNASSMPIRIALSLIQLKGFSVVLNKAQEFHNPLKEITGALEELLGYTVNANVYITPQMNTAEDTGNQAFDAHFDWMDGIVIQVAGCKVWRIGNEMASFYPLPDTVYKTELVINIADVRTAQIVSNDGHSDPVTARIKSEFELVEGTALYMPRGWVHEAATNCSAKSAFFDPSSSSPARAPGSPSPVSIHVTFGLEAACEATTEIFLHHFIQKLHTPHSQTYEERIVFHIAGKDVDTGRSVSVHVESSTLENWLHLFLHIVAAVDCNKSQASSLEPLSEGSSAWVAKSFCSFIGEKGVTRNKSSQPDGSVLRRTLAVTTFAADRRLYPTLPEVLPAAYAYLSDLFSLSTVPAHTSADEDEEESVPVSVSVSLVLDALSLALELDLFDAEIQPPEPSKEGEGYCITSDSSSGSGNGNRECEGVHEKLSTNGNVKPKLSKGSSTAVSPRNPPTYLKRFLTASRPQGMAESPTTESASDPGHNSLRKMALTIRGDVVSAGSSLVGLFRSDSLRWSLHPTSEQRLVSITNQFLAALKGDIGFMGGNDRQKHSGERSVERSTTDVVLAERSCAAWDDMMNDLERNRKARL